MAPRTASVIVVGGGLAGLSCAMKLAESGVFVHLVSLSPAKRSHSVCAQGGINAALNMRGENDSPLIHAYETIKGGDFLADQPPVVEMCCAAPAILKLFDRMGCPFNRSPEGKIDTRRFGGSLYSRTLFCGSSTGQQLVYTLDEQVRRSECMNRVVRYEHHEFLRLVQDKGGRVIGIVLSDIFTQELRSISADAVVIATGGLGVLFSKSTNSTVCTGAALGRLFMQGAWYANPEFIQIHPTAIPGEDKLRLMSESVRGEGGRVWVYGNSERTITSAQGKEIPCGKTGQPWYFLEELFPAYGNLVPRDIASREILRICDMGLGVDGKMQVYLDVRHLDAARLKTLESVLDIYEKFTGEDPKKVPMRIFPAMHYSMGGAWVDWPASEDPDREKRFRQMTNLCGCFVIGEADFQYHGANRLGANSLLSCVFSGLVAAKEITRYIGTVTDLRHSESLFTNAVKLEESKRAEICSRNGSENIYRLHDEAASWLVKNVTVQRNNTDLFKTVEKLFEIRDRMHRISLSDTSSRLNQTYQFAHQFESMVEIGIAITKAALLRNESRGAHAKPEFPQRLDEEWLKTTMVEYQSEGPKIWYRPVDCRYVRPEKRDYTIAVKSIPHFVGLPEKLDLPI
jgi:succinate dehydrogenase / fumarate reductase flavoprotein subunit